MEFKKRLMLLEADDGTKGGGGSEAPKDPAPSDAADGEKAKEKVTFTDEQQAKIEEILAKVTAKKERELEEALKLEKMSEDERTKHKLSEYEAKLKAYEQKELLSTYKDKLSSEELPREYAEIIPISTADEAQKAITFLKSYKETVTKPLQDTIDQLKKDLANAGLRQPSPAGAKSEDAPKKITLKKIY